MYQSLSFKNKCMQEYPSCFLKFLLVTKANRLEPVLEHNIRLPKADDVMQNKKAKNKYFVI